MPVPEMVVWIVEDSAEHGLPRKLATGICLPCYLQRTHSLHSLALTLPCRGNLFLGVGHTAKRKQ